MQAATVAAEYKDNFQFSFFKTTKKGYRMKTSTVFAIGRWMPIHLGHKGFLVKLARSFDRLVIGIGSCYENGTPRNCIPAVEREKLLRRMLRAEGIENAVILPIEDRPTFEEWIHDVCRVCDAYHVTHFCTGNKEDILDVLNAKGIRLDVEMINPEDGSDFPYHATDIRNAILREEWDLLDSMIPAEIKPMVLSQVAKEIRLAAVGEGQAFIPGRQTVDLIFLVRSPSCEKTFLLIGKRNREKIDFPGVWAIPGGGIREFESPISASLHCFLAETGIDIALLDNADEPAPAILKNLNNASADLHFIGIYSSADEKINGSRGGGSQCFALITEGEPEEIAKVLHSTHDMDELRFVDVDLLHREVLAYDQKRMVLDALVHLGIAYDNGEYLECFSEDGEPLRTGVSRREAHEKGVLHGAAHTFIAKRKNGVLYFLLQRRAACKDSFPLALDISSAGHIAQGSDFLSTAQKELREELGLHADKDEFTELFSQKIRSESEFRGKRFLDCEVNRVYLLWRDVSPDEIRLQPSEVLEVLWLPAEEILSMIREGQNGICIPEAEFTKVLAAIAEKNL